MHLKESFHYWSKDEYFNAETRNELLLINDPKEIEDRFYKELEFGTGGLRGIIGAGTNRMNIYTVRKASQGVADYIQHAEFQENVDGVAIAYDSRRMSKDFALEAACVFAANGIRAYVFKDIMPTPILSYTVRYLKCAAGIVITASHNPKEYNGYKVYGMDGGQITDALAKLISECISRITPIHNVKRIDFDKAFNQGLISWIEDDVFQSYLAEVMKLSGNISKEARENLKIVYSPLHGTGYKPVTQILTKAGYTKVFLVDEQCRADSDFCTVKSPNPEDHDALRMAIDKAKEVDADLVIATDPDSDRLGLAFKNENGEYMYLNGNQLGCLMLDIRLRSNRDVLTKDDYIVKTIVTTKMADAIAKKHGVRVVDVLTGFKYIGEKIKEYEKKQTGRFIFGFEESYGYLAGTFVRDKDAMIAALLACDAAADGKRQGLFLGAALDRLYKEFGYYLESLKSYTFQGKDGKEKIKTLMEKLRASEIPSLGNKTVVAKKDYLTMNCADFPKSDVLYYEMENDAWLAIRPSGTEPKLKIYYGVKEASAKECEEQIRILEKEIDGLVNT